MWVCSGFRLGLVGTVYTEENNASLLSWKSDNDGLDIRQGWKSYNETFVNNKSFSSEVTTT